MNPDWSKFLVSRNAHIESDRVQHFGNPTAELTYTQTDTTLFDLSHLGLIRFSGEEAQSFLQGQLSCDVDSITPDTASYGSYCTPKGRLLASFLIWRGTSETEYLMQLPEELINSLIKRLRMFVLRAKVTLQDNSNNFVRIGITGSNAKSLLQDNAIVDLDTVGTTISSLPLSVTPIPAGQIICHSEHRFEIIAPPAQAISIWEQLSKHTHCAGAECWDWLEISEGIPTIQMVTQEQFIPQMVNLDVIGGVNFKKGCYPGQEIVARTQYLGKLKRRMYRARINSPSIVTAGDSLFSIDTQNQACGMIVNAAPSPDGGVDVLAVIQNSSVETNSIHWKTPDGPELTMLPLPYKIP